MNLYIAFTRSNRRKEVIPDSYNKWARLATLQSTGICMSQTIKGMDLETQTKTLILLMLHPWYGLIRFTLEACNFTLNIFQDFVFTYFKQERQCLCNYIYQHLKLILGITKLKTNTESLGYFWLYKCCHCTLVEKVLPKHSMVILGLVYSA